MSVYAINYDLIGKVFGHLTVIKYIKKGLWLCQCDCGRDIKARSDRLRSGETYSCGCRRKTAPKKVWNFIYIDENTYGIPLTKGQIALIDKTESDKVKDFSWKATYDKKRGIYYAVRTSDKKLLHRILMGSPKNLDIDHVDHNTLNDRKSNLRVCSRTQNNMNRSKQSNNSSGYKGVRRNHSGNYYAEVTIKGKSTYLGTFTTAIEASCAYIKAAKKLHGEFYFDAKEHDAW